MYQQHKFNFFEQIAYAVGRPMQYFRLTKVSGGRMTAFVFLFILLTSLISSAHMFYGIFGPDGLTTVLREEIPDFELSNGELYVSERIEETSAGTYILIDTDVESFDVSDIDKSYIQAILVSRSNVLVYQYRGIQETRFSDIPGLHLDNSIIDSLMPFFTFIMILVAVFVYLFGVAGFYISALLYSIIGFIVNSLSHANLRYFTIFKTALYAKVAITILFTLTDLLPITVPFEVKAGVGLIATSLYIVFGILSHTSKEAYEEAGILPPGNLQ